MSKQGIEQEQQEAALDAKTYLVDPTHAFREVVAVELELNRLSGAMLRLLWLRRRLLWRFLQAGVVAGLITAFAIPNWYTSTAHLMPPEKDTSLSALTAMAGMATGGGTSGGGGLVSLASDLFGTKTSGELYLGVLQSRMVQDDVINRFDLRKVYWRKRYEDTRKKLEKNTDFEQDHKSGILTIAVSDSDPARAVAMTQAYIDELNSALQRINTSAARQEREFLEQRIKTAKSDLDQTSKAFSDFAAQNMALNIPEQSRASVYEAAQLQGQLIAAETELNGLEQIYTPNNARVLALKARVDELRRQITRIGGVSDDSSALLGSVNYPSLRQLPRLGLKYAELYRDSKIAEVIYETLVKQYEMARLQEVRDVPVARVLDSPSTPERKAGPHRIVLICLITLAVGLLGAVVILVEERWKTIPADDLRKIIAGNVTARFRRKALRT